MQKKLLFFTFLILLISLTGASFFVYSSQRDNTSKNYAVSINESLNKNDVTINLKNLVIEDKKITLNYQLTDSIKKIVVLKLFINGVELNSLTGIAEGEKDNLSEELLFSECPYKVGDLLDIQFHTYNKEDGTLSNPESLTFSVPINKILPTTEFVLNEEISMKRGTPKVIQKVLLTAEKVHVFHDSFNADIEFESKTGDTYYKLSSIGLKDSTSLTNIPINYGITNGTLHISGNNVTEKQSIEITKSK